MVNPLSLARSDRFFFFFREVILFPATCGEHDSSIDCSGRKAVLKNSFAGNGPFLAHLGRSIVRAPKDKGNMVE